MASTYDPSTFGNQQKDSRELDIGKMHLDAIRKEVVIKLEEPVNTNWTVTVIRVGQ